MILNILFQPSKSKSEPPHLVFVEVNGEDGKSVSVGEWVTDGEFEALRIDTNNPFNTTMPPYNEADDFILQAADQYGFEMNDDGSGWTCTNAQLIALVRAAREQGEQDAMGKHFDV